MDTTRDIGTGTVEAEIPVDASPSSGPVRRIIHLDLDAFFASVEQRDDPSLRGKPVAVGGSRERGVVAAASYEARKFGVRSAMASVVARRKCPDLVFVKPRFEAYKAASVITREIFAEYTPVIEPPSLDEAYLDVTDHLNGRTATEIANEIRAKILERTSLTASAGVSYNKLLAKFASDFRKPNGIYVVTPRMGPSIAERLDVGEFHGIGPATAARMNALGIHTGLDLKDRTLPFLQEHFGKAGSFFYWIARGVDERPVRADRVRKSVGAERTFDTDVRTLEEALPKMTPVIDKVWKHCETANDRGRTVTLKVKYDDFTQVTRSRSSPFPVPDRTALEDVTMALLAEMFPSPRGVRLLGVSLSGLNSEADAEDLPQLSLDL